MKKIILTIIITFGVFILSSCSFVSSEMIEDAYRVVKRVVFTVDSVEIHLKEKEVYFEFTIGQEIDTTLSDGTGVWTAKQIMLGKYKPKLGDYLVKSRRGGHHVDTFVENVTLKDITLWGAVITEIDGFYNYVVVNE